MKLYNLETGKMSGYIAGGIVGNYNRELEILLLSEEEKSRMVESLFMVVCDFIERNPDRESEIHAILQ